MRPAARLVCRAVLVGMLAGGASWGASWGASPVRAQERAAHAPLPRSTLAVWDDVKAYVPFWWSDSAGGSQVAAPQARRPSSVRTVLLRGAVAEPRASGVTLQRIRLQGDGEAWRTELVVVVLDPARVRLSLDTATTSGRRAWTLDRAPAAAVMAVNAGQFVAELPWGWVVLDGHQFLPPGRGPLATTVAVDAAGRVTWHHGGTTPPLGAVRWAFQSYPTLVVGGQVPMPLTRADGGLDVAHRDARLAIGVRSDGALVIAMTRFGALGDRLGFLPFGLTVPEMSGVMRGLGAQDAVLLDGGISAQLLVRRLDGREDRWSGVRAVPLALLALPLNATKSAKSLPPNNLPECMSKCVSIAYLGDQLSKSSHCK